MAKITGIIPTFNEETNVEAALQSLSFVDELIVVDSFSTDRTLEIAKRYGAKIIQREYEHSASQKNWAIPQATHEWIVLLDADEVLPQELQKEIVAKVSAHPTEVAFWINRNNDFMGKRIKYSGWQGDKVIRLFKRDACRYEDKRVHAEILAEGTVGVLSGSIDHNTYKGIDAYIQKLNRYAWWQAEDFVSQGKSLNMFHFLVKPYARFVKHYVMQLGVLDGLPGFTISVLQAYAVFMRYVKVWLIQRGVKK